MLRTKIKFFSLFLAIAGLASVFQWNSYYFGFKAGNYFFISFLYLLATWLFILFGVHASNNKAKHPDLFSVYAIVLILYPLIVHLILPTKLYISLTSSLFVIFTSYYCSRILQKKDILLIVLPLSFFIHFAFSPFVPSYISFFAILLVSVGVYIHLLSLQRWIFSFIILALSLLATYKLYTSNYFDLQWKVNEKIVDQYRKKGNVYTVTETKDFQNFYKDGKMMYSTSDLYMFYEGFVLSAFQIKPHAKDILFVGSDKLMMQELQKIKGISLQTQTTSSAIANKFDLIFIEDKYLNRAEVARYLNLLRDNGALVVKDNFQKSYASDTIHNFHIALPSLNEVRWQVISNDSINFSDVANIPAYLHPKWYRSETYELVANQGKYLGIIEDKQRL